MMHALRGGCRNWNKPYLCSMIEVTPCIDKLVIVPRSVCRIVQVTAVCPLFASVLLKIDTDAVGFVVTEQFTDIHIRDFDGCYVVVHQTFVSEEEKCRERQCPTLT